MLATGRHPPQHADAICWLLLQWGWQAATALLSDGYHSPAVKPGKDCALRNKDDTLPYQVNFGLYLYYRYYTESRASEVPEQNNPFLFQKQSYLSPHKEPAVYLEKFGKCVWFNGSGVDQCLSLRHLIFFNILLTPSLPRYLQFHSKTYYLKNPQWNHHFLFAGSQLSQNDI